MYALRCIGGWYRRPGICTLLSKLHLDLDVMFRSMLESTRRCGLFSLTIVASC